MLKPISVLELTRRFRSLGFTGPTPSGKHPYMERGSQKVHIPNPHGKDVPVGLLKRILRQAGISEHEWESAK